MVFGLISLDGGAMSPTLIQPGIKISFKVYEGSILGPVIMWLQTRCGPDFNRKVLFTQGGAPGHTSNSTQAFLMENLGREGL